MSSALAPSPADLLASTAVPRRELPVWPVYLLFGGFPLFWVLGLGAFAPVLCAVPMALLLALRRDVRVPVGFAFWLLFVAWVGIAALMVDDPLRLAGFAVRLSNYVGVTVLFLYVYNSSTRRLPVVSVLGALGAFFAFVVFGGWLGVLVPAGRLVTPVWLLLPDAIANNSYVDALVRPAFAEIQQPYGSPTSFSRPSAPFPYTNGWGCNVALLVPLLGAAFTQVSKRWRIVLAVLCVAAVVPAFATLNRGLYIAIGVALAYVAIRLAVRGRFAPLLGLVVLAAVALVAARLLGVDTALEQRLQYSETNAGRVQIYGEAFRGALDSPLLGNGAPRPSPDLGISVGTQGQIWNVMFSYGFPGLVFFLGWFAWVAWVSRRWSAMTDLWVHAALLTGLLTTFFYGYDGPQLSLVVAAGALAVRAVRPPDAPPLAAPLAAA